mgnify:CR=1 FL=1|tara:strand:- start:7439 stop:8341 length:903 start_codon:yes stop_codon:yes gene_type:complete
MKKISVTALAKQLKYDRQEVVDRFVKDDLIYKSGNNWKLTELGKSKGGEEIHTDNYKYLVWPDSFNPFSPNMDLQVKKEKLKVITATKIGVKFGLSSQRVNNILSEIGWQEKAIKGWELTGAGKKNNGIQKEHSSGRAYVTWPTDILDNEIFLRSITPNVEALVVKENEHSDNQDESGKKSKYPNQTYKAKDGHVVKSRGELVIDNMLYDYGITHAYERLLPIKEVVISDFYIPARNPGKAVYIEFWGISDDKVYSERKKIKIEIYNRENYNLISIEDKHLNDLEKHLPKMLLEYDIRVE